MKAIFKDVHPSWMQLFKENNLHNEIEKTLNKITNFSNVFPSTEDILSVFKISSPENIKVVIIGQDPYHGVGQANGVAFSVKQGVKIPPSLRNIFKELESDLAIVRNNTDLTDWVKQGVLLMNSSWTVESGRPASHNHLGWEKIVIEILSIINILNKKLIYCLWGNHAKKIYNNIRYHNGVVIQSSHPSPLSYKRGFEGTKPFSKINVFLDNYDLDRIQW